MVKSVWGPPGIPIIGNGFELGRLPTWKLPQWLRKHADVALSEGHNYMKLQLVNKYFLVPLNAEAVKPILDSNTEITKGVDYKFIEPWIGTGLLTSTGTKWKTRRRLLTPTFHFKMLDGYVAIFDRESRRLCKYLEKFDGKEVDLFPIVKNCALDVICESAMGVSVNALETEKNPYVKALLDMGWLLLQWALNPINWFLPFYILSGRSSLYKKVVKELTDFTKNVIAQRKKEFESGNRKKLGNKITFLDLLLEANQENKLSDEDIREEVDTFMFEGHDTTSSGIAWILWSLACHSEIQEKVYEEIKTALDGFDSSTEITVESIKETPYFDSVIKESNRLWAPVPLIQRDLQNDFNTGQYILPAGATILIAPIVIQRNPKVWGENYLDFKPERFDSSKEKDYNPFDYIPFSAGPRNCIGQRFALLEEKVMVMHIVKNYRMKATMGFHENEGQTEIVTKPHKGIRVLLEKR
ncbi:unnamed protein product, partial [Mesorhabditis belari]|uniref:Cytochrome P450 n=1 Tax=Mesorhabditis belari TaxID=2138241 RepID=A0AAF3FDR2_9BILA